MNTIRLYLKATKFLIKFILRGSRISPSKVLHIQQSFYHQIKGLFDKKIFPFLRRVEQGESDYENNLVGAIIELNQKFEENLDIILESLPPSRSLWAMLNTENTLKKFAIRRDLEGIKRTLPQLRDQARKVFVEECSRFGFDIANLLKDVGDETLNDYREVTARNKIKIISKIPTGKREITVPFNETSTWRDILRNLIVNAIEACEVKGENNSVTIEYRAVPGARDNMQIVISDTGCGMDAEALANYHRRGFTRGKETGSGLGIVEEYIEFLNRRGKFAVDSVKDKGTAVTIGIDVPKMSQAGKVSLRLKRWDKTVKVMVLLVLFGIFFFVVGGKRLIYPEGYYYIAGFAPGISSGENRPDEFEFITLRTESGGNHNINFVPSAIKIAFGDSVGPICTDIDKDGDDEMVAIVLPPPGERKTIAGVIQCFDATGDEEWEYPIEYDKNMALRVVINRPEADAIVTQMLVMDINYDNFPEIITMANFSNGISQMAILDRYGDVIQRYIHFGKVDIFEFEDKASLRNPIIAGANMLMDNRLILTRVMFRSGEFQGAPYPDTNIASAEEIYYVMENVDSIGIVESETIEAPRFYNCFLIGQPEDLYVFQVTDGRMIITPNSMQMASIDYDEKLFNNWWTKLKKDGMIASDFGEREKNLLGKIYRWRDNQREYVNEYDLQDSLVMKFRECGLF